MTPPERTSEQLAASLAEADRVRQARKKIKADLKAGHIDVASVFDLGRRGAGDTIVGRMRVGQVLRAVPGVGKVKAARLLAAVGVSDKCHLDDLPSGARDEILADPLLSSSRLA